MGDDVTNIIVTEPTTEEEETYEAIGEELLSRLDEIGRLLGETNVRIIELESRIVELESREFASIEHSHEGFAPTEHSHDHEHQREKEERKPDRAPEKQHPYFRKLGEL